ncbi:MAG TPA: TonB family protein [Thermoanaerobaculaceae bacterium]|nr:TonB family protein [Thermoanaerobaculaceae bacterium]
MDDRHLTGHLAEAAGDLAFKDDLTGLFNRRLLSHLLDHWWDEMASEHGCMALLILDLDRFKEVNDSYGHLAGDTVLRTVAETLRRTFRANDILVRFGGDEFVVLLPGAGTEEAGVLGDRARHALAASTFKAPAGDALIEVPVSFSLGVASFPDDGGLGASVLQRADERLYLDKHTRHPGTRNRRWSLGRVVGMASLAVLAMAALVGLVLELRPASQPSRTAASPTRLESSPQWSRELALLVEIERLRFELEARVKRAEDRPQPEADREDIESLRSRLEQLQGQLATGQPSGAASPAPRPLPAGPHGPQSEPAAAEVPTLPTPPAPEAATRTTSDATLAIPPQLLRFDRPVYPEMARRFQREAVVDLRVKVSAAGKVVAVTPLGPPLGLGFDEAARLAAFSAVYAPGTRNGVPIPMETNLTVQFRLAETR